jgi:L-asparaginase
MRTRLIVTGGTIDKQYDPLTGELTFGETYLPEMLARARPDGEIAVEQLFMKESTDLGDAERAAIATACRAAPESGIVITHGTSAMAETAQALASAGLGVSKVIVLTGAVIPYSFGGSSDAMFNLGSAIAYCAALPPGVYIAMHGTAFESGNVRKDTGAGMFTAINQRRETK